MNSIGIPGGSVRLRKMGGDAKSSRMMIPSNYGIDMDG
jgi:hypothetical protein